jgi:hypothetical protein
MATEEGDFAPMHAAFAQLKTPLLRHLLVASIVLGMLLVPATCANATGPHSIYLTPMAQHDGAMDHATHHAAADDGMAMSAAMPGMTAHEHAMHMQMEHAAKSATPQHASTALPAITLPPGPPATIQGDEEIVQAGIRLTDLPSTMAMVAISNPLTIAELDAIQLPAAPVAAPRAVDILSGRTVSLELPPPRAS